MPNVLIVLYTVPVSELEGHATVARDGCVVRTEPLADLLTGFVSRWRVHRPATAGQFTSTERGSAVSAVGPVAWLEQETRQHDPDRRGVPAGTIERIMGRRSPTTELRTADALVSAIGCPEAFHDGTLEIRPNPCATPRERAACCGGSLVGVAYVLDAISAQFGPRAS